MTDSEYGSLFEQRFGRSVQAAAQTDEDDSYSVSFVDRFNFPASS